MAARKRKRTVKRARGLTVKSKLGNVIKSLQDIKKHVSAPRVTGVKRAKPKGKRGYAKTVRDVPVFYEDEEPITLDSPTLRRPARNTLVSARDTLRSF